jgi:hypothetical protein
MTSDRTRRDVLGRVLIAGAAATTAALVTTPTSAQAKKTSQSAAKYQDTPKDGLECDMCTLFQAPNACQVVEGVISPKGWCALFSGI